MPLSTPLSQQLGIKYPIVTAPMFIISTKEMIVAAARAGILGTMPSINARTPEAFEAELAWIRERTDKPFGINFTLGMLSPERLKADLALCFKYKVPVLVTSYGDPTAVAQQAKENGVTVLHDVISLRHGQKAVAAGVDALIAVSAGAGGHAGTTSPFVLVPYLKDALKVPVLAAGCISDGRQMAAALALGADAAYMGTRFIASDECAAADAYKRMVVDAHPEDIVYTDKVSGVNANFLRKTVPGVPGGPEGEMASGAKRWRDVWSAGQGAALVRETKPLGEIVEDLVREYHDTVARLG